MANWSPISGTLPQYDKTAAAGSGPASGYYLKFYNTSNVAINMASDKDGGGLLAKCQLDSSGYPLNGSSARFIPYINQDYRIALYTNSTDADADTTGNADFFPVTTPVILSSNSDVLLSKTEAEAIADTTAVVGKNPVIISDRADSIWDYVLASGVTPNTFNIVQCTGDATLALVLRIGNGVINAAQWGLVFDGTTDNGAAVTALNAVIAATPGLAVYFPIGVCKSSVTLALSANGVRVYGECWRGSIFWYSGTGGGVTLNNVGCELDHMHITSLDPATSGHLTTDNAGTGTGTCGVRQNHVDSNVHHNTISYFNDASLYSNAVSTTTSITIGFSLTVAHNYIRYCWGGVELKGVSSDTLVFDNTILDVEKYGVSLGYDWATATQSGLTADNAKIWCNLIQNVNKNKNPGGGIGDGFGITVRRGATTDIRGNYLENYDAAVGSIAYGIHLDGLVDGTYLLGTEINSNNAVSNTSETTYSLWLENCYYGGGSGNHFAGGTGSVTQQSTSRWFDFGVNYFTGSPATPYVLNGVHSFAFDPVNAKWVGSTSARRELDFDVKFLDRRWDEVNTFADLDATPDVSSSNRFNTFTNAITITDFDGGVAGQKIRVASKGAITYDTTGTNLSGSSVDIVTSAGDITTWECDDGTTWILTGFVDVSANNSAGA